MNEFGKSTVSRSGRTRQLRRNRQRPIADRDVLGLEVLELIAHGDLLVLPIAERGLRSQNAIRNPQSKNGVGPVESDGLRHRRSPESWDAGCLHVHEEGAAAAAALS